MGLFTKIDVRDYNKINQHTTKGMTDDLLDSLYDLFYGFLDDNFESDTLNTPGLEEVICFENFFPSLFDKEVDEGKWIRIKTDVGYNVYYAKPARKVLNSQQIENRFKRLKAKKLANETSEDLDKSLTVLSEQRKVLNEMTIAQVVNSIPSDLKYAKYLRTKTQWSYVLPHEYEIVSDIDLYVQACLCKDNKKAVKYRQLFTKEDHDQVFYMQSRGIPKDVAIMMCRLQQCYFVVDTQSLFNEAISISTTSPNIPFKKTLTKI